MDFQFQPENTHLFSESERMTPGLGGNGYGIGGEARVYPGRGAGGKLRSVRRASGKKATPYDRPASGRHATSGGNSALSNTVSRSSSSLASRLVGSAARFITSSASYFFPYLFQRNILALPAQELTADEEDGEEMQEPQVNVRGVQENKEDAKEGWGLAVIGGEVGKEELDLEKVEDMLKNKTWSRDQIDRIAELLKARIMETPANTSREEEAAGRTAELAVHAVGTPMHKMEEAATTPISEAQRWREELKQARTDCMPIEVARAYMGERTASRSRLLLPLPNRAHQIDRVAELRLPPGGLAEDRYRSFPVVRSWGRSPTTQVRKRSSFLEEEWMTMGPVRRTRQKDFHSINSSPYARDPPAGETVLPRTHASPPIQSSQTARKILDTLEILSPSPKGKVLSEDCHGAIEASPMALTPDIRGRRNIGFPEVSEFSSLRNTGTAYGKVDLANFASNSVPLSAETIKESNLEDKPQVAKFLSGKANVFAGASSMFPGISTTTSLVSFPATDQPQASAMVPIATFGLAPSSSPLVLGSGQSTPSLEAPAENKPLFSFSLPSSTTEKRNPFAVLSTPAFASSATFATSVTSAASSVPATTFVTPPQSQGQRRGTENQVKEEDVAKDPMEGLKGESMALPFGTPPFRSPFSSKPGSDTLPLGTGEGQSAKGQTPTSEAQSVSQLFSTSLSSSTTSMISNLWSFGVVSGSQSSPFSSLKPSSLSGPLFGASPSITKPSTMPSLIIEPSNVPFTFSPPPVPLSCSTPTFSFGSNATGAPPSTANAAEVSLSASKSSVVDSTSALISVDSNLAPVFSFTSPSGGPKLPTFGACETSFPVPASTFGGASTLSNTSCANAGHTGSLPTSGQTFRSAGETVSSTSSGLLFGSTSQIGISTSFGPLFGSGTVSGGSMFTFGGLTCASFGTGQSFGSGAGSLALPAPLTFGGPAGDSSPLAPLFGSGSGSESGAEIAIPSAQRGVDFSTGLTSGEGAVEKSDRRFLRAKRKK